MGINDPSLAFPGTPQDYYRDVQKLPFNRSSYPDPNTWKNDKGTGLTKDELAFVLKFIQRMQMEGKYSPTLSLDEQSREQIKDRKYYEKKLGDE